MKAASAEPKLRLKVKSSPKEPRPRRKELEMRKVFEIGGVVAAAILVAFGIAAIVIINRVNGG